MSVLPKNLREKLDQEFDILPFSPKEVSRSNNGRSFKALLETEDQKLVETVLISPKPGSWSICVSSQVGCPLGCLFCATGKSGFERNLSSDEIEGQILFWIDYLKKENISENISNIVFMGMGEPFLNLEEVSKSIKDLIDPEIFGFGSRSISVSTSGLMDKWNDFAEEFPQVNLALSLHSASDEKRSEMMPINETFGLEDIRKTLKEYLSKHKRKVFIEYLLLSGFNDSSRDARQLSEFLRSIGNSYLLHVNLIRYNETGTEWRPSSLEAAENFLEILKKNHIQTTIRQSLGNEIQGACGQLAGNRN